MVEPLYPRLGLLGGAPEAGGKVSKLAALAAARKKKEGATPDTSTPSTPQPERSDVSSPDVQGAPRSLRERLAASGRSTPKPSGSSGSSLGRLARPNQPSPPPVRKESFAEPKEPAVPHMPPSTSSTSHEVAQHHQSVPDIRASPSTFASTIVGISGPTIAEPSHVNSNGTDLLKIYGQDNAEPFDFAAPSPDDVVLNAQNTAKGLAIRRKA